MKRNKIAAGALALAMGLGAVAPSFAAEPNSTDAKEITEAKKDLSPSELFKEQYKSLLERTNKERDEYLAAKDAYDKAQEAYKASEDKLRADVEEYDNLRTPISENLQGMIDEESRAWTELDRMILGGVPKHLFKLEETDLTLSGHIGVSMPDIAPIDGGVELKKDVPIPFKYIKKVGLSEDALVNEVTKLHLLRRDKKGNKFTEQDLRTAYRNWENAQNSIINVQPDIEKVTQKLEEVKADERDRNVKLTQCKNAKAALDKLVDENGNPIWEKSLAELKDAAESYKLTVEATEKGILVEDKDNDKKDDSKKAPTKDQLDKLTESINEAKATIKAVDILKETASHISDKNKAYLDKLVEEANALIKEGQAILDNYDSNSVAFSLFSTAYAAEQETVEKEYDAQDVEDLTNKINDKNAEIKDAIKKIDEEEKAADEKDNKDNGKKEDEKETDEKDNKDNGKKEDEKETDEKDNEENGKKEDEKETDEKDNKDNGKKETTIVTPSKNASSNRTAGRNAKTGIAGVAGVAGVLAAASVAYAASKKNN